MPTLRITSYAKSKAFYVNGLGFAIDWEHRFEPHLPVFMQVSRDGMAIFLSEHAGDCPLGGLVHLYVPDVDAWFMEFERNGVAVQEPPNEGLQGLRSMTVIDPDGNKLRFHTRLDSRRGQSDALPNYGLQRTAGADVRDKRAGESARRRCSLALGVLEVSMNWRAASFLCFLTAMSCAHDPVKNDNTNPAAPPPDQPIAVHNTTQLDKLQAAIQPYIEKARSTYPSIKARYLAGLPDGAALFITVQLHDAQARMEQVFVQVEKIEGARISGIIWDDIRTVQGFHKGQRYAFPESELIDWTLSNADGTEEGNVVGSFLDTWHGAVP